MATIWSCPKEDCPATEIEPAEAGTTANNVPLWACAGGCGERYPWMVFTGTFGPLPVQGRSGRTVLSTGIGCTRASARQDGTCGRQFRSGPASRQA